MPTVELRSFDILTASPVALIANSSFWTTLPRIARGPAVARLLMVADTLRTEDVFDGFRASAAAARSLPVGVEAYRTQYEEYLRRSVRDVRYLRTYLTMNTGLKDEGFIQFLGTHGMAAMPLRDPVPRPFGSGNGQWRHIEAENGYWGLLVSQNTQAGTVFPTGMHRLFSLGMPLWASMQVYTYSHSEAARLMRLKETAAGFDPGQTPEAIQDAGAVIRSLYRIRQEINQGGAGLHTLRLYVLVHGETPAELDSNMEIVSGTVPFQTQRATDPGSIAIKAFGDTEYEDFEATPMTTGGVALLTGSILGYRRRTETRGVMMGVDRAQAPVILNLFDNRATSYNMVVLGQTGAGKTFAVLLLMLRHLLLGTKLIIVDPQGNIDLSFLGEDSYRHAVVGTKGASVNIMDIVHDELATQIDSVLAMMTMLNIIQRGNESERSVMDAVLTEIYKPLWKRRNQLGLENMPVLANVLQRLEMFSGEDRYPHMLRETAKLLAFRLRSYTEGSRYDLFGRRTEIDFSLDKTVMVYDVSRLPQQEMGGNLRGALLSILVADLNQAIRRRRREGDTTPILFFIDEMGVLMRDEVIASHVSAEYKTARARRVSMIVADQDIESLMGPRGANGTHFGVPMLLNAANTLLFRQKDSERGRARETFPALPESLVNSLSVLPRGTCVAMLPDDLLVVNITPGEFDKIVLSSRLEDRQRARAITEQMRREVFGVRP